MIELSQNRFVVFYIEFQHACQRKFDAKGKEVEPNFGATQLVRTGYLQSSYSELVNVRIANCVCY